MTASWWFWDPRHVLASRDAVRAASTTPLHARLLAKLDMAAKDPSAGIRFTKAQVEALADCLASYQSSWAREAQEIVEQALRLAAAGVSKPARVEAARELLDAINRGAA